MKDTHGVRRQVAQEAAEWLIREKDGDLTADEGRALAEWLASSPLHIEEYLAASVAWTLLAVDKGPGDSLPDLVERARLEQTPSNIVSVHAVSGRLQQFPQRATNKGPESRKWGSLAAAIALVALAAWGAARLVPAIWGPRYATAVGEQRSIILTDGSVLTLNTDSAVRVRYSGAVRAVELQRGEGRFQVARDEHRPFVVSANGTSVRAIGTVFDVRLGRAETRIAVIEGHVAVDLVRSAGNPRAVGSAAAQSPPHVELRAGQQVTVNASAGRIEGRAGDIESVTAWVERRLIFRAARLTDVIAEFNRYRTHPLTIDDAAVGSISISGVFHIDDPESLMSYLVTYEGMQVIRDEDGSEHIRRGRGAATP